MPDPANVLAERLRRMKFRAWHRGTREADYIVGCFFDRYHGGWDEAAAAWFETLLNEEDPDVLGWAMGTQDVPAHLAGEQMETFQRLDYVEVSR